MLAGSVDVLSQHMLAEVARAMSWRKIILGAVFVEDVTKLHHQRLTV